MARANDDRLSELIKGASTAFAPSEELRGRLRTELAARVVEADAPWRDMLAGKGRRLGFALAAAVLVVAVFALWPSEPPAPIARAWWQGPPAAWAQEIATVLQAVEAVTCRETTTYVNAGNASSVASSRQTVFSTSHDSYRRDHYDNGEATLTQWYTPSGDGGMHQTDIDYKLSTYRVMYRKSGYGEQSPVSRMTFLVGLLDKADAMLGTSIIIEGRECIGFEISAAKYGDNAATDKDRIWFDVDTRLPVRTEHEWNNVGEGASRTLIQRRDQFNWAPELTVDFFQPVIPAGFVEVQE